MTPEQSRIVRNYVLKHRNEKPKVLARKLESLFNGEIGYYRLLQEVEHHLKDPFDY